jgi:hypothetical protein
MGYVKNVGSNNGRRLEWDKHAREVARSREEEKHPPDRRRGMGGKP